MSVEELLKPRYEVIADYPNNIFFVGQLIILDCVKSGKPCFDFAAFDGMEFYHESFFNEFPNLFKKMNWWEKRTLDELMSILYVRITVYTGYWVVGDIVKVTDYKVDTKRKKLEGYILDSTQYSIPERCEPATLEEFNLHKNNR